MKPTPRHGPAVPLKHDPAWYGQPLTVRPTWRQGQMIRQICRATGMTADEAVADALTAALTLLLEEVTGVPSVGTHPVHRPGSRRRCGGLPND